MTQILLLAQSEPAERALIAWLEVLNFVETHGASSRPESLMLKGLDPAGGSTFAILADRLEFLVNGENSVIPMNQVIVLVDSVRPRELTAVTESLTWDHLVARLVLCFPEIVWVFGVIAGFESELEESFFPAREHGLLSLVTGGRREPLFDATGLRDWVRRCTNETLTWVANHAEASGPRLGVSSKLPIRKHLAASIDDEKSYAYFHAYAAYRYGFRADVVTSWALMSQLFDQAGERIAHGYDLLLEDMRLNFPDKPADVHLSSLRLVRDSNGVESGRSKHCRLLDDVRDTSRWRFLITTGQVADQENLMDDNEQYLRGKLIGRGGVFYKPFGGVLEVWEKTGLTGDLSGVNGGRAGNADDYEWPPLQQETAEGARTAPRGRY